MGTIWDILYKQGDHPLALSIAFIAKFHDTYTRPGFCSNLSQRVPIVQEANESDLHESSHKRQQSPLKLLLAITNNDSERLTTDKAWIDLEKPESSQD